jgi:hypothetical protein
MSQSEDQPFSDSHLESPAYRERLMRKLNCLIAVLEVACAKVRVALGGPEADRERLLRIQKNLQDTLDVCQRAKRALERRERLPADLPWHLAGRSEAASQPGHGRPHRALPAAMELCSLEEAERFRRMPPIRMADISSVDLERLARMLQA